MSLSEDPDRPATPIKIGWVFDVLVPEDAPPTDLSYVSSIHGGFEHHGFEGRTPGNIDSYNSSNGLTRRYRYNLVGATAKWYPVTLYSACSVVHADGLYEESPVVPASIAGVAQGILAQENPDAAQLRLARKVMELMGDDSPADAPPAQADTPTEPGGMEASGRR